MTKKSAIILGTSITIICGLGYCFFTNKQIKNEVIVTVDNSLSTEKIRIDYGFYSINSGSDQNLLKIGLDKVLFGRKPKGNFETICGENDFLIVYDNEYYTVVRHFIPNDFYDGIPEPHMYVFDFKKQTDKIQMTLKIEGEYGEKIERDLVKVIDANENIWGRKISKNK